MPRISKASSFDLVRSIAVKTTTKQSMDKFGACNMASAVSTQPSAWEGRNTKAHPSTLRLANSSQRTRHIRISKTFRRTSGARYLIRAIAAPTSAPSSPQTPALSGVGSSGGRFTVNGLRITTPGAWEAMYRVLKANKVKGVSPHELKFALEREVTVVDVRVPIEYAKAHIPGAKNVPIYQSIKGWTPWKILRRAGFALFGVFNATEPNANFTADLARAVGGDQGTEVILFCNNTSDLTRPPPPNNAELWHEVFQSRSLIAAYLATIGGFTHVSVLKTGFKSWQRDGRPVANLSDPPAT